MKMYTAFAISLVFILLSGCCINLDQFSSGGTTSGNASNTQAPSQLPTKTADATSDSMIFDTTDNYLGACDLTDTSSWSLNETLQISLLQIWYKWDSGENTTTYVLKKDGADFASGTMVRADCDPYQGNWCNGNYLINKAFTSGNYELKVPKKQICLKPGVTGAVRLYGKRSG